MDPINCIQFIENNRRFVSFGDDKKVFMWEFGVPLVIKNIFEEELSAIYSAQYHPNQNYIIG